MIHKAFSFNLAFFNAKDKENSMWFLRIGESYSKVTCYSALLNILNSWDFKRCLILLKAQHESNLKLVLSITFTLFIPWILRIYTLFQDLQ